MLEQRSTSGGAGQDPSPSAGGAASLRDQHADVTRAQILGAARSLFVERGYAPTSVRQLAERAGVAVQTIYSGFGSKAGVLLGLLEGVDRQEVEPISRRLAQVDDPVELLAMVAMLERKVREQAGDVLRVVREAAAYDSDVERVWNNGWERHRSGVAGVCERLAEAGWLREDLDAERATVTALALTSLEAYDEVMQRRGWTHDEYQRWLTDALRAALLRGASRAEPDRRRR